MPRTRDMVIFIAALLFLLVSIAVTYAQSVFESSSKSSFNLFDQNVQTAAVYTAFAPQETSDREAYINKLRSKIQDNKHLLSSSVPSVEEVVVEESDVTNDNEGLVSVDVCDQGDISSTLLQKYPLQNTSVTVVPPTRFVMHTTSVLKQQTVTATSTTTPTSTPKAITFETEEVERTLIAMPLYPQIQPNTSCVAGPVVGVTASGALLLNQDASAYYGASAKELIGFAQDGFPIYGPYEGETDVCGGYMHPEGYRYTLNKNRDYILGCFVGQMQTFTL